jgi:hypothetical protein
MENTNNPFRELDPDIVCPPAVKDRVFSEIDLIRNTLQIVELFGYDIFSVLTTFLSGLETAPSSPTDQL